MHKSVRRFVLALSGVFTLAAAAPVLAQDDLLARIKSNKEITVATEARYAPFEYVDNGKIVGYDADLMAYVLKSLPDVKVKQLDLPFQGLLPGLDAKRFDIVVTAVTVNKDRADHFAFTLPVADATTGVLLRANESAIKSPNDLNGKVVGSQTGSAQLQALVALDKKLKEAGGPGIKQIKQYVSFDEAYADLAVGRLDAVAQSVANLGPLMKSRPGVFTLLPQTIGPKSYFAWVARKDADSAALLKLFSDGIARANKDGTMKKLQEKWFGSTMDVPADALPAPTL
ncbi:MULTISPECIES: transporter substrate-binding domain-containing protein [Paraburkholderia]|jgi:polar amino acid transport system substrate-binding protein|uniref:Amino acid ABC transporter substrate-binding protein (PAAT family) n=1 Tax=Paraburkholderia tropica TaxID=92647 RepID=A0A1A5XFE2_9BURK|nr:MULTISPECIES: transporter substrate-binding domain-containing protein [Paraburkholderia]MBB2982556.1 polar amino acid transport system substrate-binding protein [Paraburkholderia tropica]MBB3001710.1 polar amino acid transport system substrate-binding protein [Paraburkholderia tropica]MBB6321094.1 polar amino acid transport system substrate-binding protein [Paraburkholderia tropica]MBN3807575.1 transporter substrate-binding domain-containing protein [Paraburkholderia sp. Ac-20347]MDE1144821